MHGGWWYYGLFCRGMLDVEVVLVQEHKPGQEV